MAKVTRPPLLLEGVAEQKLLFQRDDCRSIQNLTLILLLDEWRAKRRMFRKFLTQELWTWMVQGEANMARLVVPVIGHRFGTMDVQMPTWKAQMVRFLLLLEDA